MNPDPDTSVGEPLEGEAVIKVKRLVVVDGDHPLPAEIETALIAGMGLVGEGLKPGRFLQELGGEAFSPAALVEGQQLVPVPLTEIREQMTKVTAIESQVQGNQALVQGWIQLLGLQVSCCQTLKLL